jgi:conjugative coupling factor TraD (SXT/TOL subfamily)
VAYAEFFFADETDLLARVVEIAAEVNPERQPRFLQGRPKRLIAFETLINEVGRTDDVLEGLRSAFKYEKSYFDKIVASLLPLLEKLTTGRAADLLSPDYLDLSDVRPIFDWRQIVNQSGVVYVGLDALTDSAVASAVGNSMFADLVSYAGERYKHGDGYGFRPEHEDAQRPIVVHLDEFAELMGDEFIPMINKGGAASLQITAYSQTYSDIHAGIGSEAKAKQVAGNFNNLIMFRVKDVETASILTEQLPEVSVHDMTLIAGYNDSSDPHTDIDFTSRHEDRITSSRTPMIEAHDIVRLPKGQAFALLEGGTLYKLRLPLPEQTKQQSFHAAFDRITEDMHRRYRTSSHWWMADGATDIEVTG